MTRSGKDLAGEGYSPFWSLSIGISALVVEFYTVYFAQLNWNYNSGRNQQQSTMRGIILCCFLLLATFLSSGDSRVTGKLSSTWAIFHIWETWQRSISAIITTPMPSLWLNCLVMSTLLSSCHFYLLIVQSGLSGLHGVAGRRVQGLAVGSERGLGPGAELQPPTKSRWWMLPVSLWSLSVKSSGWGVKIQMWIVRNDVLLRCIYIHKTPRPRR